MRDQMMISDVMTPQPTICSADTTIERAAATMRDRSIGDVLVRDHDQQVRGIVTDRDLVVRGLAEGRDARTTTLAEVCTRELHTVSADATIADVIALMERHALRRIPVESGGAIVGIVSLGDLATALDASSLLGKISSAPPVS